MENTKPVENARPKDKVCGSCGGRLVPVKGCFLAPDFKVYDPEFWRDDYTHAGPMFDRHGAYPVEDWDEEYKK